MYSVIERFLKDESGATAIEYSLIAAGIAVVIVGAVGSAGRSVKDKFDFAAGEVSK